MGSWAALAALRCLVANATYTRLAGTAVQMIAKYGRSMALRSQATSGPEWDPVIVTTDTAINGVVVDYSLFEIDGTVIQQGDKRILVGAAVMPTVAMKLVDGVEMSIVNVKEIKPGDTVIAYEVQAR